MAIPLLTPEQRAEALRKATAVRSSRRLFKDEIARGDYSVSGAIAHAKSDDALAGIRVSDLLQCLPGMGPKRASDLMDRLGIAPTRRIRGLGTHQVAGIIERTRR